MPNDTRHELDARGPQLWHIGAGGGVRTNALMEEGRETLDETV
jgi:hypothetical protein